MCAAVSTSKLLYNVAILLPARFGISPDTRAWMSPHNVPTPHVLPRLSGREGYIKPLLPLSLSSSLLQHIIPLPKHTVISSMCCAIRLCLSLCSALKSRLKRSSEDCLI
jgi:hypothetical protein